VAIVAYTCGLRALAGAPGTAAMSYIAKCALISTLVHDDQNRSATVTAGAFACGATV